MMADRSLEEKIAKAVDNAVPDIISNILSQCDNEKGKVICMEERKNRAGLFKFGAAAAAVLIMFGIFGFSSSIKMNSTVFLDVNPSIELVISGNDRIKSARALNNDAKLILEGMNLKNTDLEVGVNAIIGSMLKNGYISDLNNSILVSVENKNEAKNEELQQKITKQINDVLGIANVNGAVLSQSVNIKKPEADVLCENYGISKGKAELILAIREKDPQLLEKDLAGLTINELNLLMDSKKLEVENVVSKGEPSYKRYIDPDEAKRIALKNIGVSPDDVIRMNVSLDSENNELVYEVEVYLEGRKYDVDINAVDKRVVSQEVEITESTAFDVPNKKILTTEEAKLKVLKEFKVSPDKAGYVSVEADVDDGRYVYEVKFVYGDYKYSMTIDGYTGEVLKREAKENKLEFIDSGKPFVGKVEVEDAISSILESLGISRNDAGYIDIEIDKEDGRLVYEADFKLGNKEFSFTVDADTGKILDKKIKDKINSSDISLDFKISMDEARKIAVKTIGLIDSDAKKIRISKDVEDGRACYKTEAIIDGKEYSLKIDASTGNILENKVEQYVKNHHFDYDYDYDYDYDHDYDDDYNDDDDDNDDDNDVDDDD